MKVLRGTCLVGIDQSARGTAAVKLVDGQLAAMLFWADSKTDAKRLAKAGARAPVVVKVGDEEARVKRLVDIKTSVAQFLREEPLPAFAAMEDYALARQAHTHTLGEVGGVVRLELWRAVIPFRVYDVQSIKMFATGNGAAEKADMVMACRDRWEEHNFLEYGKTNGAAGNLADAYTIAQLLRVELAVRQGLVAMEDLEDQARRVLLRTTKQKPVNVLDTPFVGERHGG